MQAMCRLSISTVWALRRRMLAPSSSRIFRLRVTSEIMGTFSMRQTPSTIRAAGMMATAAFLAPLMVTSPKSGLPPRTRYSLVKVRNLSSLWEVRAGGACLSARRPSVVYRHSFPPRRRLHAESVGENR